MIDISCSILFGWTAQNISFQQKVVSYAHLYSYTSVKTLVHWFQIIRSQTFQMYDDEASGSIFGNAGTFYKVAKFPTKNIHSPIALIYGGIDSLVEYAFYHVSFLTASIDVILAQLPRHTVAKKVENYEHLDLLWGKEVDKVVFPHVLDFLRTYAEPVEGSRSLASRSQHNTDTTSPPAYSTNHTNGFQKRDADTEHTETSKPYTQVTSGGDMSHHDGEWTEGAGTDSEETMSDDHSIARECVSLADAGKMNKDKDT